MLRNIFQRQGAAQSQKLCPSIGTVKDVGATQQFVNLAPLVIPPYPFISKTNPPITNPSTLMIIDTPSEWNPQTHK